MYKTDQYETDKAEVAAYAEATTIKRETEVDSAIGELRVELKRLQEVSGQVGPRLVRVLHEASPEVADDDQAMRAYSSELAQVIQNTGMQLAQETSRLRSVLERLEV